MGAATSCTACWWWPCGKRSRWLRDRERILKSTSTFIDRSEQRRAEIQHKIQVNRDKARREHAEGNRQAAANEMRFIRTHTAILSRMLETEGKMGQLKIELESIDDMRSAVGLLEDIATSIGRATGRSLTNNIENASSTLQMSMDRLKSAQESLANQGFQNNIANDVSEDELLRELDQESSLPVSVHHSSPFSVSVPWHAQQQQQPVFQYGVPAVATITVEPNDGNGGSSASVAPTAADHHHQTDKYRARPTTIASEEAVPLLGSGVNHAAGSPVAAPTVVTTNYKEVGLVDSNAPSFVQSLTTAGTTAHPRHRHLMSTSAAAAAATSTNSAASSAIGGGGGASIMSQRKTVAGVLGSLGTTNNNNINNNNHSQRLIQ